MGRGFRTIAPLAARAAEDKKGEDIVLLDVHRISTVTDFMLVVSVTSPAHLEAVEEGIERQLSTAGVHPLHRDGLGSGLWRVLDYGGLIVHLMHPRAREFYSIEKLYHDALHRAWQEPANGKARRHGRKAKA